MLLKLASPLALAFLSLPALAMATPPACPSSQGGYVATVSGNSVIVCPTVNPNPPSAASGCPFMTGMDRVDVASGAAVSLPLQACVPAPDDAGSASTSCYEDECVPPGTYEYGYQVPPFIGCINGECVGPTSGETAAIVTVTSPLSASCTATLGSDTAIPSDASPVSGSWAMNGSSVSDGGVFWSGTCKALPDAGLCEFFTEDDAGSSYWAACPDIPHDAGASVPDAGVIIVGGPKEEPTSGSSSSGGGCSVGPASAAGGSFAPLFALTLASVLRSRRKRREGRAR